MKKSKKSRVPPQGESRAPARAPAWSHSGSGRGGIPTARNPPRKETQGPDFFHFFDFFRFLAFSKNIKRFFWFFEKNQKNQKNEKNQKNPGCPRRESQGLQPGLQPGATQDPGEEGFPRPETPHAGRPRVPDFSHFFDFLEFFRFLAFSKKIKKSKFFY